MSTVIERIETILTSEYSVQNYVEFVREVFAGMDLVAPDRFRKEFSNFSSHIAGSSHIGNYTFPDGKKLIIFSVQLLKRTYVEGSRSTQRSYAKRLIENANADAAFIAFYTEDDPKWRVSLVRLDYEMKFENGKLKTAENMTPAKRYSYLVGKDEPCHTAIDRFRKFITDATDKQEHPTLDELEEAFSVEAVTNEFFALYCEKFHQLREHLERSEVRTAGALDTSGRCRFTPSALRIDTSGAQL
jgi:adenine-specific DNA-methyltransferase